MDRSTVAEHFAQALAKQQPYQHGVAIGYVDTRRESPNWTGVHYFLGTHEECEAYYAAFFAQPTVEGSTGSCMALVLN